MSADKLTESDSLPDRSSGGEDKPFPGAPEDRGPAPELPKNTLSMEEVRAAHQRAGSNAEFEAGAEAHARAQAAGSSDSPGSGAPDSGSADSGSPGEGPVEGTVPGTGPGVRDVGADGTAVPDADVTGGRQPEPAGQDDGFPRPEGTGQPEGFTRPERELPPFPGAPEDRGPAPAVPNDTPDMDYVRSVHQKATSNAEFEAMAEKDAAARKEAAAAKPGGDAAAREAASPDSAAGENGEQPGEETDSGAAEETTPEQPAPLRAPQQEMPAAEAPDGDPAPLDGGRPDASLENQPDARHEDVVVLDQGEDAEAEPAVEGMEPAKDGVVATRSDAAAPETDYKPVVAGVVEPDRPEVGVSPEERETGGTDATRSEVRLDKQSDDERSITVGEVKALFAEMTAANDAKFEAMQTEHETEKAELKQKVSELEAKLEAALSDKQVESDRPSNDGEQTEPPSGHDAIGRGERSEAPGPGDETEMTDRAVVRQRGDVGDLRDENLAPEASDRPDLESAGKDALGLAGAFSIVPSPLSLVLAGDSARRSFEKMSPEDQYSTITALDTLSNAFSSLSPGTAVVAATASIYGPAAGAKARQIFNKIMRKD